jgi:hypothetical protein
MRPRFLRIRITSSAPPWDRHQLGDRPAFHLPCCRETLAVIGAQDHCCWVRPTIPSGEPPPRAPAVAGHFSGVSVLRRTGCGSRLLPPPSQKACPHAKQSGPPPAFGFQSFSAAFYGPNLGATTLSSIEPPFGERCGKQAILEHVNLAPVRINWNEFSSNALFALVGQFRSAGGLVLLSGGKLGPQIFPPLASLSLVVLFDLPFQRHRGAFYSSRRRGSPARELNCCEVNVPP